MSWLGNIYQDIWNNFLDCDYVNALNEKTLNEVRKQVPTAYMEADIIAEEFEVQNWKWKSIIHSRLNKISSSKQICIARNPHKEQFQVLERM